MKDSWQEIPIDEYRRILEESEDDKDFRRRLKEWKPQHTKGRISPTRGGDT